MAKDHFHKYQALGNDMVVLDPADFELPLTPHAIRLICHRHLGLGADGICYGPLPGGEHPRQMRFFNPNGSEAEKSGNGLRIFARYLWDQGLAAGRSFDVWINGERILVQVEDEDARTISTTVGRLSFQSDAIPVLGPAREVIEEELSLGSRTFRYTAATVGNPHCVIFLEGAGRKQLEAAARLDGPALETAPPFPNRTNVQFAHALDGQTLEIAIWERGAGITLASGTSACAAAGAAVKTGRCRSPVEVRMAGGTAWVAIDEAWRVTLTGTVQAVCQGMFSPEFLAQAAALPVTKSHRSALE